VSIKDVGSSWSTFPLHALSAGLLAACGGGGDGSSGASTTTTATATAAMAEPCPAPVTADCVVQAPSRGYVLTVIGGRESDYALSVRQGELDMVARTASPLSPPAAAAIEFRFSGGTTVEHGASLRVDYFSSLHSDVVVQSAGYLQLSGAMTGNSTNMGTMLLGSKTMVGSVLNDGILTPASSKYDDPPGTTQTRIEGTLSQSSAGTLDAVLGATSGGFVSLTGRADVDGTLRLAAYNDAWGPYPLPTAPFTVHVLHADGGIFGRFAKWTSPGLLVTGTLRYLGTDILFDVDSISKAQ
jgi:hypothetical protein